MFENHTPVIYERVKTNLKRVLTYLIESNVSLSCAAEGELSKTLPCVSFPSRSISYLTQLALNYPHLPLNNTQT